MHDLSEKLPALEPEESEEAKAALTKDLEAEEAAEAIKTLRILFGELAKGNIELPIPYVLSVSEIVLRAQIREHHMRVFGKTKQIDLITISLKNLPREIQEGIIWFRAQIESNQDILEKK